MKLMTTAARVLLVAGALITWNSSASAQTTGDTGTTGDAIGQTNINITEEADTSAFETIDRSSGVGGAATTAVGGGTGGGNAGTQGGFGGGGGFGGLGALNSLFGGGGGFGGAGSNQPIIRTRLRSAIEVAPISPQRVQVKANSRFTQSPRRRVLQNISVNMVGRTAVINGTVTSDRDRRMSELLLRLEPGISSVQNNVIVNPVNQ